jgi:uncharacterized protein YycO
MSTCTPYSLLIGLHRAPGVFGRLIRWQTRSDYSHASLYLPGQGIIEAREGKGVQHLREYEPKDGERIELYRIEGMADADAQSAWEFAEAQIGKAYDWTMVLRFVSRRQESRSSSEKWFCSELVYASLKAAGIELLRATDPWEVSPGLLGRSPRLSFSRTLNF